MDVRRIPVVPALLALGPLVGLVVLGVGAPHQSREEREVLGPWLTWTTAPWRALHLHVSGTWPLPVAVGALVLLWLVAAWLLAHRPVPSRLVTGGTVLWGLPFALGAPFLSRDVYAYVAQGEVLRLGMDPYRHPAAVLGRGSHVLGAVDPMWRGSRPPYGPLALRLEDLAARLGAGREWLAIGVLRLVAVVAVVAAVVVVRRLAPPHRRDLVTWLAASPLVLLQLVSATHLEALMSALLVASVALALRGRLAAAVVVGTLAAQLKVTAGVVVAAVVLHVLLTQGRRAAGVLAATSAGTFVVSAVLLLPSHPLGWVGALSTPTAAWNPFTPSTTLFLGVSEVATHLGLALPSYTHTVCRGVVAVAGAAALLWVVRRAPRHTVAWTAAAVLAVTSLAAPVVWPWYLAPAALLLLAASRLSAAAATGAAPALAALSIPLVHAQRVGIAAEAVTVVGLVAWLVLRRQGRVPQPAALAHAVEDPLAAQPELVVTAEAPR